MKYPIDWTRLLNSPGWWGDIAVALLVLGGCATLFLGTIYILFMAAQWAIGAFYVP